MGAHRVVSDIPQNKWPGGIAHDHWADTGPWTYCVALVFVPCKEKQQKLLFSAEKHFLYLLDEHVWDKFYPRVNGEGFISASVDCLLISWLDGRATFSSTNKCGERLD